MTLEHLLLTPSAIMFGQPNLLPKEDLKSVEEVDQRIRAHYLRQCKNALWSRWTEQYTRGSRERHNLNHKTSQLSVKRGEAVLIRCDERNSGKWNIGVVVKMKLTKGKENEIRTEKSSLEKEVQML